MYSKSYFKFRSLNDDKRIKSFILEKKFILKHTTLNKIICDVGCSTGEFLTAINWTGRKFGMEINKFAITKAKKANIYFNNNILNKKNFFDVIVFRGTIQHIEEPFFYLKLSYKALKKGGLIFFLATPNINSLHYKIYNDLPALDKKRNFFLPSDVIIKNIMKIYKFKLLDCQYPYFGSGYNFFLKDFIFFILKIFGFYKKNVTFPGNMMNLVFKK
jgi:SAM-dependent methyltransferase